MKVCKIPEPYYRAVIYLAIDCTADEIVNYCKSHFKADPVAEVDVDNADGGAIITLTYDCGKLWILWLSKSNDKNNLIPGLAHEIFHLAGRILKDRGIELNVDNDEPMAYLIEYLTAIIMQKVKGKK